MNNENEAAEEMWDAIAESTEPHETTQKVDAVHEVLEDLTPPEALEILKMVSVNLKAEIRDFVAIDNLSRGGLWQR